MAAGARTGFASVVTALLFLLSVSLAPLLGMVPAAATAPVLIMVGIMMASDIGDIDWRNLEVAVPAYFTMMIMCFGYNIADGIAIGFIMFSFVKLAVGKWSEVSWLVRGLSAMFLLRFVLCYSIKQKRPAYSRPLLICAFYFYCVFISYLRYSFSVFFTPAKIEEEA